MRYRKNGIFHLQIRDEPVYTLETHALYVNDENKFIKNLKSSLQKALNFFCQRGITVFGRGEVLDQVI